MGQNLLDSDSFGGTDNTALPTYNANWNVMATAEINDLEIKGTPGIGASAGGYRGNYRTGQTWTNDQWAEFTVDGTTVADLRCFVMLRAGTGTTVTGYMGGVTQADLNNIYRIGKYNGLGTFTNLLTEPGNTTIQAGDIVNVQVEGTTITLKVTRGGSDAFTPISTTDSTYTTNNPGLIITHGTANLRLAGSWKAGSVTAGGVTPSVNEAVTVAEDIAMKMHLQNLSVNEATTVSEVVTMHMPISLRMEKLS